MRVEPGLTSHPKYLRLRKAVGIGAADFLVRLWGHCQQAQKGEYWRGADSAFVEAVCAWDGEDGKLFSALVACRFIEQEERGIRIHKWKYYNSQAVANWYNGNKGGRPKKPADNPVVNPMPNQVVTHSGNQSQTQCEPEREREGKTDRSLTQGDKKNGTAVAASRTRWAALTREIKDFEARGDDLTLGERAELLKKKGELAELQKNQAAGKF